MRFRFEANPHTGFDIRWIGLIPIFYGSETRSPFREPSRAGNCAINLKDCDSLPLSLNLLQVPLREL